MPFSYENNASTRNEPLIPPLSEIDQLWTEITDRSTELEAAKILLKDFAFLTDVLRNAHRRTTAKLGFEVYRLRTRMMALLPPKPPADTTKTLKTDISLLGAPPRMDNSETEVPYGIPATPAGFSAEATALWHRDFCFATDTSDLNKIMHIADNKPISFGINPDDPKTWIHAWMWVASS
jgi:hypothetical protein